MRNRLDHPDANDRLTYTAYFDESGHSASEDFVAIAAFVADDETWARFDAAWNAVLTKHSIPFVHAVELNNRIKTFGGWTSAQQIALAQDLLHVIHTSGYIVAAGAVLSTKDFKRLTKQQQDRLVDPFYPLFQEVIFSSSLETLLDARGETVRMTFSQQDEFSGKAKRLYEVMKTSYWSGRRFGELKFENMRGVPGLQAADVLVYELCKYYKIKAVNSSKEMRHSFRQIMIQQRAFGTRRMRFLSYWYLRLQLTPWWIFRSVTALITFLIAVPAYFYEPLFGWVLGDPILPKADREMIKEFERRKPEN